MNRTSKGISKGARCADVARHTCGAREPRRLFVKCRVTAKEREDLHALMAKTGHKSEADFIRDAVFNTDRVSHGPGNMAADGGSGE